MNKWKIIFLSVIGLAEVVLLAITIGYLVMGINTPDVLAGRNLGFTGCYILSLAYFLIFALVAAIGLICLLKWRKNNKKTQQ